MAPTVDMLLLSRFGDGLFLIDYNECFYSNLHDPPQEGVPGPPDGLGRGRGLGLHQTGLHPPPVPRPHPGAPPGRGHRAIRQQDAR